MEKIKNYFSDWTPFEKFWQVFVIVAAVVAWAINRDNAYMLVMTLTATLATIPGAKGKLSAIWLMTVNALMYAYMCFGIKLYGEVMYNLLYSVPMNLLCIYTWKKNTQQDGNVKFRVMSGKLMLVSAGVTALGVLGYMQVLKFLGGNLAFMDSLTTVASVVGSLLFVLRYAEQWLLWVFINVLQVAMWVMVFASGTSSALLLIIMKSISVVNSLYAYHCWKKNAQED